MATKKSSGKNDYLGLSRTISLILAIIPVTSGIFGAIARIQEGHLVCGIARILFGWNILWVVDLILMILQNHILRIF